MVKNKVAQQIIYLIEERLSDIQHFQLFFKKAKKMKWLELIKEIEDLDEMDFDDGKHIIKIGNEDREVYLSKYVDKEFAKKISKLVLKEKD